MSQKTQGYKVTNLVGTPTDYSDKNNWAHLPKIADKDVDTLFIYPTVYINPEPGAPAIVPVEDEMLRAAVQMHYREAPMVFEDSTNVYEPYYRQSNLCALVGDNAHGDILNFQMREQRTDVYAALDYFFEHYNQGRPFILAGHSQGSVMLKIALVDYFQEHVDYLERNWLCHYDQRPSGKPSPQVCRGRGRHRRCRILEHRRPRKQERAQRRRFEKHHLH